MRLNNVLNLCLFLSLTACNQKLPFNPHYSVDSTLQQFVQEFEDAGVSVGRPIHIDNLVVRYAKPGQLEPDTLGECFMYDHGQTSTPLILINPDDWSTESVVMQRAVMFHELGHCVLWREHDETWLPSGIVKSIMYPYIQNDLDYVNNWPYYVHEMFYGF